MTDGFEVNRQSSVALARFFWKLGFYRGDTHSWDLVASEASNLCLRVEPGDQINANSFPHFQLGGKDAALCAL